eukprot:TRINITY_DN34808_c0_g1_i1.p1 TRINITY_DN34808_c0_g1~~TRINITY_DN34808_c0_g1_i1.p1  ORF type:complete len:495 (-),score=96.03 TRINITY_DN34808_c0_g1_i1:187-1671(-)
MVQFADHTDDISQSDCSRDEYEDEDYRDYSEGSYQPGASTAGPRKHSSTTSVERDRSWRYWLQRHTRKHQRRSQDGIGHPFPMIRRLVVSTFFEVAFSIIILANCGVIGWQAELRDPDDTAQATLFALDHCFTALFFTELVLRLLCYNWTMLFQTENFLDIFLVALSTFSIWIATPLEWNLDFLRKLTVLRTLRLARLGRSVRHRPEFKEMWALMKGLTESFATLLWTYVMIGSVLYVFAIMGTYLIGKQSAFKGNPIAQEYFGDVALSMLTLFQVMTLDSWTSIMRPLAKVQPLIVLFFIVFISIATFVLMNLIVAVIVENAFENANGEQAQLAQKLEREKEEELEGLRRFFKELDADGSGQISFEEFTLAAKDRKVRQKLRSMDIMPKDMLQVWDLLDDGDGELSVNEFVDGLRRLQGEAKAKDILILQRELKILQNSVEDIEYSMDSSRDRLDHVRTQIRRASSDIEAFQRTMSLAKEAMKLASRTQRLSD